MIGTIARTSWIHELIRALRVQGIVATAEALPD